MMPSDPGWHQPSGWREIIGVNYGPDDSQVGDLYVPSAPHPPVVCLVHGGFWRLPYAYDQMTPLARDLASRGYAVWNLEYRRINGGGGWPATFADVAAGFDHLRLLREEGVDLDLDRVYSVGHSAGGHLALWLAGRDRLAASTPGSNPRVPVAAAVGQAPVSDVRQTFDLNLSNGVAAELLYGTPAEFPARYHEASPAELLPLGVPQLVVHGTEDDTVPIEMSRTYVKRGHSAGDRIDFVELPGTGHFEHLDPAHEAWKVVADWLNQISGLPGETGPGAGRKS